VTGAVKGVAVGMSRPLRDGETIVVGGRVRGYLEASDLSHSQMAGIPLAYSLAAHRPMAAIERCYKHAHARAVPPRHREAGGTATGIRVPEDVDEALGKGKRRSTGSPISGSALVFVSVGAFRLC